MANQAYSGTSSTASGLSAQAAARFPCQQLMRGAQSAATRAEQTRRGAQQARIDFMARRIDREQHNPAGKRKPGHHETPRGRTRAPVQSRRRRSRGGEDGRITIPSHVQDKTNARC